MFLMPTSRTQTFIPTTDNGSICARLGLDVSYKFLLFTFFFRESILTCHGPILMIYLKTIIVHWGELKLKCLSKCHKLWWLYGIMTSIDNEAENMNSHFKC